MVQTTRHVLLYQSGEGRALSFLIFVEIHAKISVRGKKGRFAPIYFLHQLISTFSTLTGDTPDVNLF